jgi:hypothetical protein
LEDRSTYLDSQSANSKKGKQSNNKRKDVPNVRTNVSRSIKGSKHATNAPQDKSYKEVAT